MQSPKNRAIIAVAGARKTQTIIDSALATPNARVLITTFTNANLLEIRRRIEQRSGAVPPNIQLETWFAFLLRAGVRPYQHYVLGRTGLVRGLNFKGRRHRFAKKARPLQFFLDPRHNVFRDGASHLACQVNEMSDGRVIARLEKLYDDIYIDEVQDMVGYDLDFLDLLFESVVRLTVVGDPRQHTLATNQGTRHRRYRGAGLMRWFERRAATCVREDWVVSHRCNQSICDFASALFPNLPPLRAGHEVTTGHDGISTIEKMEVGAYVEHYQPQILRDKKTSDTLGFSALNIGVSKGATYDRVLVFPTRPMRQFLDDRDPSRLRAPERLYVAVTRARHSVTFVL